MSDFEILRETISKIGVNYTCHEQEEYTHYTMNGSKYRTIKAHKCVSYDICIVILRGYRYIYEDNYTYNVYKMYREAFRGEHGIYILNDKHVTEAIPLLNAAIEHMSNHVWQYEELNPSNGWGNYTGALNVLMNLRVGCLKYSNRKTAVVKIT